MTTIFRVSPPIKHKKIRDVDNEQKIQFIKQKKKKNPHSDTKPNTLHALQLQHIFFNLSAAASSTEYCKYNTNKYLKHASPYTHV